MATQNFNTLLEKAGDEWRVNVRLRFGVYLLLGIFWIYGILVLKDFAAAEKTAWESMESKIARARATAAAADWPMRAQEVKAATTDLETLLWREGSIGLSQASFEERVSQSLAQSGVSIRSIRTSAASDGTGTAGQLGLVELRARVQTDFRATTFYPWLSNVSRQKFDRVSSVFVESLIIRGASFGQSATAEMELVGYALRAGDVQAGGQRANSGSGAPK